MSFASTSVDPRGSLHTPLARICTKLVLQAHATDRGASYTLYLKLQLPHSSKPETYPLLPDHALRLKDSVVHPLDAAGAAPALSESAAAAASHLAIPLSLHHSLESPPLVPIDGRATPTARRRSFGTPRRAHDPFASVAVPEVSVSNFHINLIAPPLAAPLSPTRESFSTGPSTPKRKRKDVCGFIVILHFEVGLAASPPRAPYIVRLPKPYCLNNYLKLALDDSANPGPGEVAVEIDPLILPRSRSQRRALNRPKLSDTVGDDDDAITLGPNSDDSDQDDDGDDGSTVTGPFESCDAVVVRWADPTAGDFRSTHDPAYVVPSALRADLIDTRLRFSCSSDPPGQGLLASAAPPDGTVTLRFEATSQLRGLYFPGLDADARLPIELDFYNQQGTWQVYSVEASAGLVSWTQAKDDASPQVDEGPRSNEEPDPVSRIPIEHAAPPLQAYGIKSHSNSAELPDDDDLLNVAPPSGISDTNMDFSFDSTTVPSRPKARRRSIVSRTRSSLLSPPLGKLSQPAKVLAEPPEVAPDRHALHLQFSVAQLAQADWTITVTLQGAVTLQPKHVQLLGTAVDESETRLALPVLRFPTATEHFSCTEPKEAEEEAAPDSDYVFAGFRWSQWTGSDGCTKLDPFPSNSQLPPGHGFNPEANVVTVKTRVRELHPSDSNSVSFVEETSIASAAALPVAATVPSATAALCAEASPVDDAGPVPASTWSNEAVYSVRPIGNGAGDSHLAVRLQLDWPSYRGQLLPVATLQAAEAGGDIEAVVAFINGRQVGVSDESRDNGYKLGKKSWRINLPPSFEACTGAVKVDVLLSAPWDGSPDVSVRLPSFPWNAVSFLVDVAGDNGRRPLVHSCETSMLLQSRTDPYCVRLAGLCLAPDASIQLGYTLETEPEPEAEEAAAIAGTRIFGIEGVHEPRSQRRSNLATDAAAASTSASLERNIVAEAEFPNKLPPLRRREKRTRSAPTGPGWAHPLWSSIAIGLVSFFAWYAFRSLWPMVEELDEKVGYLAAAHDIDFYDGSYGLTPRQDAGADSAPWHLRLFEAMAGIDTRRGKYDDLDAHRRQLQADLREWEWKQRRQEAEKEEQRRAEGRGKQAGGLEEPKEKVQAGGTSRAGPSATTLAFSNDGEDRGSTPSPSPSPQWDPDEVQSSLSQRKVERSKWLSEQQAARTASASASAAAAAAATAARSDQSDTVALAARGELDVLRALWRVLGWPLSWLGRAIFG
ncbi:hypothetical protein ACQY0O_000773 [Thecaphora frezii]